jgi:hypothetical protein
MRIILVILLFPVIGWAQVSFVPVFDHFSETTIVKAHSNIDVGFMTSQEEEVVFYMNLVRLEPYVFLEYILKPYVLHHQLNKNHYVKSLYSDLKKAKPTVPLLMKADLYDVAELHLKDIGVKGIEGHTGSNGKSFKKRVDHLFETYLAVSENIGLGFDSPLDNVIGLLIDDGVKDVGHRKAILSLHYNCVGVSLGTHKNYVTGCVMDFGFLETNKL